MTDETPPEEEKNVTTPAEEPVTPSVEEEPASDEKPVEEAEPKPDKEKPVEEDRSWLGRGSDDDDLGPDASYRNRIKGGFNFIGDNITAHLDSQSNGRQTITMLRYDLSSERIERARKTFVRPRDYPAFHATLGAERILYLRGTPGSGRRHLAEMLLADVADGRVTVIQVTQTDVSLAAFAGGKDLLPAKRGIVLELASPGSVSFATLAALAETARKADGYVVVLGVGTGAPDQALHPYEAMSPPPDPRAVLEKHLAEELRERPDREVAEHIAKCLDHDEITARLLADPQPGSVTDLARALAGWDGTDGDLERALNKIRARVRELAARLVKGGEDEEPGIDTPRRQAVQIAHAAFDGHPLSDVFGVGQMLLDVLHKEQSGEDRPVGPVFGADVERMLRLADGTVVIRLDGTELPRRAQFIDPGFAFDVLDVVWNDFDNVRLPLLSWLAGIALSERPRVRQRAAYIAGWLASRDFDEVWRLLIRPWARSGNGAARQAAAWAVDILALDDRMLGPVRGRVADWVRGPDPRLHDAAARSYGTQLGVAFAEEAITNLRTLASRDDLNGSASVAAAMRWLYVAEPEKTREALVEWNAADRYRVRVHAARSLILLSSLPAEAPYDRWPKLLADVAETGELDALVDLWQAALTDPTTALRAWKGFEFWLRLADEDPALADLVVHLGVRIIADEQAFRGLFELKKRGRFYLKQWRASCPSARRLSETLWPADPARTLGEAA